MSFLKIYSAIELEDSWHNYRLRLDYVCPGDDSDSIFEPLPTYEYFFDEDEEDDCKEDFEGIFCDEIQFIFGSLDALQVNYQYTIENAQYLDTNNPNYKDGYQHGLDILSKIKAKH